MEKLEVLKDVSRYAAVLLSVCYLYQAVYLFLPLLPERAAGRPWKDNRYAVLIAARNEELVLPYLLDSISGQDYPAGLVSVFVVADNCTDGTAAAAREHGASVFERFDRVRVGKGYALDYLLDKIRVSGRLDDFDAFLVFDADNLLEPDYISQMNRICSDGYDAFCGYRNSKNYSDNWISSGYALWYLHDSAHLNRSRMRLGTACAVSGTGFGFTRELLERCGGWHFFTLTEDIEFNTWCATKGVKIGFCRDAVLYDEQPSSFRVSWIQRTRWVQGGLQISFKYAGAMLHGIFRGGRTGYASFETATLSFWGYAFSTAVAAIGLLVSFLTGAWPCVIRAVFLALAGTYCSMFLVGLLTLLTEWDRIGAAPKRKLVSLFTFPLFMITYIPIGVCAVFQRFRWQPVPHTVAVPVGRMGRF